jgi:hypothetical protein
MKRFFIALALVCLVAIGFSSCKGHEKCPAYGEVAKEQVQNDKA